MAERTEIEERDPRMKELTDELERAQFGARYAPERRENNRIDAALGRHALLEFDWTFWGRPQQHAPAGDWSN